MGTRMIEQNEAVGCCVLRADARFEHHREETRA